MEIEPRRFQTLRKEDMFNSQLFYNDAHLESRKKEEEVRTILHSAMLLHSMVDIGSKNPTV